MTFAAWAQSKNKSQLIVKGRRESLPYLIFSTSFPGLSSAESRAGWKRLWHRLTAGYVLSMKIWKGTNLPDPLDPCWLLEFRATYIIMTIWMLYGYFKEGTRDQLMPGSFPACPTLGREKPWKRGFSYSFVHMYSLLCSICHQGKELVPFSNGQGQRVM